MDRTPPSKPDWQISRIKCCAQHLMRYVVKRVMWCRGPKVIDSLRFSRPQHHIIFWI